LCYGVKADAKLCIGAKRFSFAEARTLICLGRVVMMQKIRLAHVFNQV
jgi:hypothetical protein